METEFPVKSKQTEILLIIDQLHILLLFYTNLAAGINQTHITQFNLHFCSV